MNEIETQRIGSPDVSFDTLVSKDIEFGVNNFLEIARKRARAEDEERIFVSMSRGFYRNGDVEQKRFKKSIALPDDPEIICAIADTLKTIASC